MGQARVWWTIDCNKHGMNDTKKGVVGKRLKVAPPRNKHERYYGGCPRCNDEQRAKERLEKETQDREKN